MSLVAFPFKSEDPAVAAANLAVAAQHPRVTKVLAMGAEEGTTFRALAAAAPEIAGRTGTPVEVTVQDRIGTLRPGKGDGMNTVIDRFLASDEGRLHFYDADITNFDAAWIDGAETAADRGIPIVRHYFPRASTDAMITWMITRPLLAIAHPATVLWRINQPLGGEILITRPVAEALAEDPFVRDRSDWGIDTAFTYATAATGLDIHEHYIAGGKQHALYGSLADIRQMVVECFEAALAVTRLPGPPPLRHTVAPATPAPPAITDRVGYDVEATLHLLSAEWTSDEVACAGLLPDRIAEPFLGNLVRPTFSFLEAQTWGQCLRALADLYRPTPGWRGVLFRAWVARVLAYTTTDALGGHARAMHQLERAVAGYAVR